MKRALVRNLTLSSIAVSILGFILLIAGIASGTPTTSTLADGTVSSTVTDANGALIGLGGLLLGISGIVGFVAWIGALVKTAQISSWGWFVIVFLLGPIALLIYSFIGPEMPATPVGYAPGYPPVGYPPVAYPPQTPPPAYPQPGVSPQQSNYPPPLPTAQG
jgi:hypothetical protein